MSDYDFTNQPSFEKVKKVVKSYPNNMFTDEDIELIVSVGKKYKVNPLVILMKTQQENSLLINSEGTKNYSIRYFRACGYGLGSLYSSFTNIKGWKIGTNIKGEIRYYKNGGFSNQIYNCTRRMREFFNVWDKNTPIMIKDVHHEKLNDYKLLLKKENCVISSEMYDFFKYFYKVEYVKQKDIVLLNSMVAQLFKDRDAPSYIQDFQWRIYVKNAATYVYYRYCPYYGDFMNGVTKNEGNILIPVIWGEIKGKLK